MPAAHRATQLLHNVLSVATSHVIYILKVLAHEIYQFFLG